MEKDFSYVLEGIFLYSGLKLNANPDAFNHFVTDLAKGIYHSDGSYNPDYINHKLGEQIPELERAILNAYFEKISNIEELPVRIVTSKEAEQFILDSKDYSDDSKERILTTFAIYRYIISFWNEKAAYGKIPNCDIVNALVHELAKEPDIEEIQDGKDFYRFSGGVLATVFVLAVLYPNTFNFMYK